MIHIQTLLVSIPLGFAISTLAHYYDSSSHRAAAANSGLQRYVDQARSHRALYLEEADATSTPPKEQLDLLDTVLLASVDGRFHAVNRTTAETIWTMDDPRVLPPATRDRFYPLVRTQHPRIHPDLDAPPSLDDLEDDVPETFIIEPQSGTIFVNSPAAYRDDPLHRLPFSVPKLVEMSPFKYDDLHTFVAKKSSAFISLDLRTGQVLDILDPDKCDWNEAPNQQNNHHLGLSEEDILDELEQEASPRLKKLEVHIGRTDYHVSVFSRGRIIQNLTFTEYGPNKADKGKQDLWRRTPDNNYFQSLPDGRLILLKAEQEQPVVGNFATFQSTVVAIFDVLMNADTQSPLVLLQPAPSLPELYSPASLDPTRLAYLAEITKQELTYVGRVGNSLYAMSYLHFPLVSFSDAFPRRRTIDSTSSPDNEFETPEYSESDYGTICRTLDCLVGIHYSQHAGRTWVSRLITDGMPKEHDTQPPPVASPSPPASSTTILMLPSPATKSTTIVSSSSTSALDVESPSHPVSPSVTLLPPSSSASFGIWEFLAGGPAVLAALASVLVVMLLIFFKKLRYTRWSDGEMTLPNRVHAPLPPMTYGNPLLSKTLPKPMVEKDLPPIPDEAATEPTTLVAIPHASLSAPQLPTQNGTVLNLNTLPSTSSLPTPPPSNGNPAPRIDAAIPPRPVPTSEDNGADGDSDGEDAGAGNGGAFKKRRRKRGRGGKKAVAIDPAAKADESPEDVDVQPPPAGNKTVDSGGGSSGSNIIIAPPRAEKPAFASSLIVTDTVLGYGSHGTVVYRGSFQGREVAVKRLLNDFVTLAIREVTLLQESDDHPNVIRYYFKESKDNFLYIALELCPASLADLVERAGAQELRELVAVFEPRRALAQVTAGLRHLHGMKIVHRDIKPQNILVSRPTVSKRGASAASGGSKSPAYRMLISDFGLCRKLDSDQTSFMPTHVGAAGAGTVGWRAPEILRGEVKLDEQTGDASTGGNGTGTPNSSIGGTGRPNGNTTHRLTKAVDIFALGCLFYYTLTGGEHPYGDRYERESNILKNQMNLSWLERLGEEGLVAEDLIAKMLDMDPKKRPDTTEILLHPFFWTPSRRLAFLQDASDRFEIMERDPREPPLVALEALAPAIVGPDWHKRLDKLFVENLGKFRKYEGKSVQDLLRAFRNKKHHYQDLPDNVKRTLGPLPHGFLSYFTKRFPRLFLHVYYVIALDPMLRLEPMFRSYFELADAD